MHWCHVDKTAGRQTPDLGLLVVLLHNTCLMRNVVMMKGEMAIGWVFEVLLTMKLQG